MTRHFFQTEATLLPIISFIICINVHFFCFDFRFEEESSQTLHARGISSIYFFLRGIAKADYFLLTQVEAVAGRECVPDYAETAYACGEKEHIIRYRGEAHTPAASAAFHIYIGEKTACIGFVYIYVSQQRMYFAVLIGGSAARRLFLLHHITPLGIVLEQHADLFVKFIF